MPRRVSNVFTDLFASASGDYLQDYDADWVKVFSSYNIMVDAGSGVVYNYNTGGTTVYRYSALAPLGDCMVEFDFWTADTSAVDLLGPLLRLQPGNNDGYMAALWNGVRQIQRRGPSGTYDVLAQDTLGFSPNTPLGDCRFWVTGYPAVTLRFSVPGYPDLVTTDRYPDRLASGYVGLSGYTDQGNPPDRGFLSNYRIWTVAPDGIWRQLPHQLRGRV